MNAVPVSSSRLEPATHRTAAPSAARIMAAIAVSAVLAMILVSLVVMHLAVAAAALPVYARMMPLPGRR